MLEQIPGRQAYWSQEFEDPRCWICHVARIQTERQILPPLKGLQIQEPPLHEVLSGDSFFMGCRPMIDNILAQEPFT